MEPKYEEMARQMRADGVSEETIVRFVAEEMTADEFRRGKGVTEIEALREWRKTPEHIRKLLLANAFCYDCGTTEFAPRALPRASGQHGSRQVRPNLRRSQGQTVHL